MIRSSYLFMNLQKVNLKSKSKAQSWYNISPRDSKLRRRNIHFLSLFEINLTKIASNFPICKIKCKINNQAYKYQKYGNQYRETKDLKLLIIQDSAQWKRCHSVYKYQEILSVTPENIRSILGIIYFVYCFYNKVQKFYSQLTKQFYIDNLDIFNVLHRQVAQFTPKNKRNKKLIPTISALLFLK